MRRFLELLHRGACPTDLTPRFVDRIGREAFDALTAAGVLRRTEPARSYPCPGGGNTCPRRVVENPGDVERPFVAVPGGETVCCPAVPLRAVDLEQHATSLPDLVRLLRAVLGIEGPIDLDDEVFPCTHRIGVSRFEGEAREVLLATWPSHGGFAAFLQSRRALRRPTLVLAPARSRWVRAGLEEQFGPGEPVELVFLDDVLHVRDGRVRRIDRPLMVCEPAVAYHASPPFCEVLGLDGRRPLDEHEYREVVARADSFDLFLDTLTQVQAGRHPGLRRLEDGTVERVALTREEALIVAELIERRKPLRAPELSMLGQFGTPEKRVEAARRAIDVRLGRYQWRAVQTVRGDDREAKRYLFNPPKEFRFAVLRPAEGGAAGN